MKVRLKIHDIAVKQLESAIWMYAYNYDEVSVHTIAGAAFELYSLRLGLSDFKENIQQYIKPEKYKDFIRLWNKPYNFFKHGEYDYDPVDEIIYDEDAVELLILLAAEANLNGPQKYQLSCARTYKIYFLIKYPELLNNNSEIRSLLDSAKEFKITVEDLKKKESLRIMLDHNGHTFINGTNTPYRDVDPK